MEKKFYWFVGKGAFVDAPSLIGQQMLPEWPNWGLGRGLVLCA